MIQNRRKFIQTIGTAVALSPLSSLASSIVNVTGKRAPRILLRSGWQTENIGDIGHTFGIMELLNKYLPEAEITLWPLRTLDLGIDELFMQKYPKARIIYGAIDRQTLKADTAELRDALDICDILVHSSGSGIVRGIDLLSWHEITKKPYGVYGVSLSYISEGQMRIVNNASFFYTRETASLAHLLSLNPTCSEIGFTPDATFAIDLLNQEKTNAYLEKVGLEKGAYICVIPRLRYTPYFLMRNLEPTEDEKGKYQVSMFYQEADHAKLREVITQWVRETGLKVLVCPEVTYQVELGKEMLVDKLPEDVKKNVIWRDSYWLPDLAEGVYAQSRALVCFEPHSPIMALRRGIPSFYLRQPSDTRKGQMWRDFGLGDWIFEIDITAGSQIYDVLREVHQNYAAAQTKVRKAQDIIHELQNKSMDILKNSVYAAISGK